MIECTAWDLLGKYSEHQRGFRVKGGRVVWSDVHYNDGNKLVYLYRLVLSNGGNVRLVGRYVPHDTLIELVDYREFETQNWCDFIDSDQQMVQNPNFEILWTRPDEHAKLWAHQPHAVEPAVEDATPTADAATGAGR